MKILSCLGFPSEVTMNDLSGPETVIRSRQWGLGVWQGLRQLPTGLDPPAAIHPAPSAWFLLSIPAALPASPSSSPTATALFTHSPHHLLPGLINDVLQTGFSTPHPTPTGTRMPFNLKIKKNFKSTHAIDLKY